MCARVENSAPRITVSSAGSGRQGGLPPGGVVVVGDGHHVQTGRGRGRDQLGGTVRPVGGGGVRVQVDEHHAPSCPVRGGVVPGSPINACRPWAASSNVDRRSVRRHRHSTRAMLPVHPCTRSLTCADARPPGNWAAPFARRKEAGHGRLAIAAIVAFVHPDRPPSARQIIADRPLDLMRSLTAPPISTANGCPGCHDPIAAIARVRSEGRGFVWIGLHEPDTDEMTVVAELFGLHELAVEDAVHAYQRPKMDRYDSSLFLVLKTVCYVEHTRGSAVEIVQNGEIMMFLGARLHRHGPARVALAAHRGARRAGVRSRAVGDRTGCRHARDRRPDRR